MDFEHRVLIGAAIAYLALQALDISSTNQFRKRGVAEANRINRFFQAAFPNKWFPVPWWVPKAIWESATAVGMVYLGFHPYPGIVIGLAAFFGLGFYYATTVWQNFQAAWGKL